MATNDCDVEDLLVDENIKKSELNEKRTSVIQVAYGVLNVDLDRSPAPLAVNEDAGDYPISRPASSMQWRAYLSCEMYSTCYRFSVSLISLFST